MNKKIKNVDTYKIELTGLSANFFIAVLIAMTTSIIPMLLSRDNAIFYTSLPFFISVVILFSCAIYFRGWGIIASALSFILYGFVTDMPMKILIVNAIINTLQIGLLLLGYLWIKKRKTTNKNKYSKGIFYLSQYNSLLIVIFLLYLAFCIFGIVSNDNMLLIFFVVTALLTLAKIIIERDVFLVYYTLFIALFPSAISCVLSIILAGVPKPEIEEYFYTWTFSNYILLQTCGYILYQLLYSKKPFKLINKDIIVIDASTLAYYIAMAIWNSIIIYLFCLNFLNLVNLIYFFPWALGNFFLGSNLIFSRYNDAGDVPNKFDWYEKRAIVVENNTSGIVTIISFLLPVSATLLKDNIPPILLVLFIVNIFCACLAVGLIWVPANNIKFMALLKTLKTIFYLFSITFLLISVIMIMFSAKI